MKRILFIAFLCLFFVSCTKLTVLRTRELVEVQDRVEALRAEVAVLEEKRAEESKATLHHRVAVEIALDRLSEMLFQLSGNVAESQNRIFEMTRLTDLIATQMAERARQDSLTVVVAEQERVELFNLARSNFDNGNFALAINDFNDFMEKYPESEDAAGALFWKAEAYFALDSLETAKTHFQNFYRENREGDLSCSALHRLGLIFHRQGQGRNRDSMWNQLLKQCPDSPQARIVEENRRR